MTAEIDLRVKITSMTDAALDACALAQGKDKSEMVRNILRGWADRQILTARYIFGAIEGLTPVPQCSEPAPRYKREPIARSLRDEIFERDSGKCAYCGDPIPLGDIWHLDHILAVSKGGTNEPANLTVACVGCNLKKAAATPDRLRAV